MAGISVSVAFVLKKGETMLQKFARKLGFILLITLCFTTLSLGQSDMLEIPISDIAWSPDGNKIAIAGGDAPCNPETPDLFAIHIVSAEDQILMNSLTGSTCTVVSVDWNSDSTLLGSSGNEGAAYIWDVTTGEQVTRGAGGLANREIRWSPDDTLIATAPGFESASYSLEVWDPITGNTVNYFHVLGIVADITSVDWSPDGSHLITGVSNGLTTPDGFIRIWDNATGALVTEIPQESWVFSVAWKPDGRQFATASANSETKIWDVTTGEVVQVISPNQGRLRWHPFEDLLLGVSGGENSQVLVWDTTTGEVVQSFDTQSPLPRTDWSPYGGRVVYNQRDRIAINTSTRSLDDDTLQIAVVAPSLERVIGIAEQCYADAADQPRAGAVAPSVTDGLTRETLPDFVAEIEALPADTIPAACAADLIAVAEALTEAE